MRIAIYDLDQTLTRRPTFTPFLIFAARRFAPWRLVLFPVLVLAMVGYRVGLYSRTTLKRFAMQLMTGCPDVTQLEQVGAEYARKRTAHPGLMPRVLEEAQADRAAGARLVIATAAFEFYARSFADLLDFPHLVATDWDGKDIPGGNCYGETKKARVLAWMDRENLIRGEVTVRFFSDSFADAPMLDWADEAYFVTASKGEAKRALARGWKVMNPFGT